MTLISHGHEEGALARVRGWLLAVLAVGLAGTLVELLLLAHYEEIWQWSPLVLIAITLGGMAWHRARPGTASVRGLQVLMVLMVASGGVGAALHMRGAAEFQLEIDPSMPRRTLVTKVLRAQSPPALAPGVMMQLGLIGLVALYRHPAAKRM
jgi:hypothetical protein